MSLTSFKNLAINILKNLDDATVRDMEVPELKPCSVCDNEILMLPIQAFTVLSCGHVFHRLCIEKKLIHTSTDVCPFPDCMRNVEKIDDSPEVASRRDSQSSTSSVVGSIEKQLQINITETIPEEEEPDQEMDVDEETTKPNANSKKRANISVDKSPSKKAKQTKVEDSRVLKKLIRELSIGAPKVSEVREKESLFKLTQQEGDDSTRIFLTLYCKITNAEAGHENSNQEVLRCYYYFGEALSRRLDFHKKTKEEHEAQRLVNDEVRDQLPKEVTKTTLWKKTERARKIYDLFRRIGSDKIQRVRSFTVSGITKLSWDKIDYVVSQISKNTA